MEERLAKKEMARIAASMLAGEIPLIDAARKIGELRVYLRDSLDAAVLPFVGFLSEIDDIPLGDARRFWSQASLAEKDRELADYVLRSDEWLREACRRLVREFGLHEDGETKSPPQDDPVGPEKI